MGSDDRSRIDVATGGMLDATFGRLPDNIGVIGRDGRWSWASPGLGRLLGPEGTGSMALVDTVHPEDRAGFSTRLATAWRAPGTPVEVAGRLWSAERANWALVEGTATAYPDDDLIGGMLVSLRDVTRRSEAEEALERAATLDPLTGLPNRALLRARLTSASARARRSRRPFVVLLVDLDDFRNLNESLGHGVGDRLLVELAGRLRRRIRAEDAVARVGGDEFVVVAEMLAPSAPAQGLAALCRDVFDEIETPVVLDGRQVRLPASVGVVVSDGRAGVDDLLQGADIALYEAKAAGGGDWVLHDPAMTARVRAEFDTRSMFIDDFDRVSVVPHYQAVVDAGTGRVVGAEALVRLVRPDGTVMMPDDFIRIAESTGKISELGARMLAIATRDAVSWPDEAYVAVNVSALQLRDASLPWVVREALDESGLDPSRLVLEVTESVMLGDDVTAAMNIGILHGLGIRFAIDDFGTGFSSVARLRHLPVTFVKIDRSFVAPLAAGEPGDAAVITAILGMADALGLTVVAEGVETPEEERILLDHGISFTQGYLYGRPSEDLSFAPWTRG